MTPLPRKHRVTGGFTLVELMIVIAVVAILSAAIVPSLIEHARTRMAERAAEDVTRLFDAAKWFYVEQGRRWPGQSGAGCAGNSADTQRELVDRRYAPDNSAFVNPWGRAYVVQPETAGCQLTARTQVPLQVQNAFRSFLPFTSCTAIDAVWAQCTSRTPRPGSEAGYQFVQTQLEDMNQEINRLRSQCR